MRIRSLDAVRGVAAAIVVAHHASLIFPAFAARGPEMAWVFRTPLRLLVAGPAAVYVFFVLSGTVLSLPFFSGYQEQWTAFAVKRFVRIWLPFAGAIFLSIVLLALVGTAPVSGVSWWYSATWKTPLSVESVASTLAMTGRQTDLDNPMWSLIHEMRIALVLPALMLLVRWNSLLTVAAVLLISIASVSVFSDLHYAGVTSWADTSSYAYAFVIGVLIAAKRDSLLRFCRERSATTLIALTVVSVAGLAAAPPETPQLTSLLPMARLLVNTTAAGMLIVLCMTDRGITAKVLHSSVPTFLGKISYSLYLIHVPILISIVRLSSGIVGLPASIACGVGASLLAAVFFQRAVEAPSARLSKRLARALVIKPSWTVVTPLPGQTAIAGNS